MKTAPFRMVFMICDFMAQGYQDYQDYPEDYSDYPDEPAPTPRKRRRKKKKRRGMGCLGAILYVLVIIAISLLLSTVAIFAANDVFALVKDDADRSFTVDSDLSLSELSGELEDYGIINYSALFKLFVKFTDNDTVIHTGTYALNPSFDYQQIVRVLQRRETSTVEIEVSIPEGYTNAQIKERLVEMGVCSEADIDEYLNSYNYKHDYLEERLPASKGWLEGYLFPDTYKFNANNAKMTLNKMLNNFKSKYDEPIQQGAEALGRNQHEIVTIASLLEREAKVDEEFARIAGVIYNRLSSPDFPRLEIDATLLYALGEHKEVLTDADKEVDSPYNTYKIEGLPPGPICNPGYTALYAATHPEDHNYYYYVAMPDGTHLFANSYEEHQQNIQRAREAASQPASEG
ncbi:endolytic transglycosylase MltG [Clostridiaceae bacterium]|nr:endolytic transglycosylase MltG [Clostridiaceae bacterium]